MQHTLFNLKLEQQYGKLMPEIRLKKEMCHSQATLELCKSFCIFFSFVSFGNIDVIKTEKLNWPLVFNVFKNHF